MDILSLFTVLTILSALFGYFNLRFLRLPGTIGLLVIAVLFTLGILAAGYFVPEIATRAESFVRGIDFEHLLMDGMLSFLLFAGALHTDFEALKQYRWPIITFATVGVLISTLIVGSLLFLVSTGLGFSISYIYCLLFGALISPTDPIAVLGILKKAGAPKPLEIKIVGESLFNDGIGVVVFLTLYSIARTGLGEITALEVAELFAVEVIGGIALGLALG